MRTGLACAMLVVLSSTASAETWPTLEEYVKQCHVIVLCDTEMLEGKPVFKVIEEWKGKYRTSDFNEWLRPRAPGPAYLPAGLSLHSGRKPREGQKVVFFFTGDPQKEKYSGSSTSFDVNGGKLIYAETGDPGVPRQYSLDDFKQAILRIVADETKSTTELKTTKSANADEPTWLSQADLACKVKMGAITEREMGSPAGSKCEATCKVISTLKGQVGGEVQIAFRRGGNGPRLPWGVEAVDAGEVYLVMLRGKSPPYEMLAAMRAVDAVVEPTYGTKPGGPADGGTGGDVELERREAAAGGNRPDRTNPRYAGQRRSQRGGAKQG